MLRISWGLVNDTQAKKYSFPSSWPSLKAEVIESLLGKEELLAVRAAKQELFFALKSVISPVTLTFMGVLQLDDLVFLGTSTRFDDFVKRYRDYISDYRVSISDHDLYPFATGLVSIWRQTYNIEVTFHPEQVTLIPEREHWVTTTFLTKYDTEIEIGDVVAEQVASKYDIELGK